MTTSEFANALARGISSDRKLDDESLLTIRQDAISDVETKIAAQIFAPVGPESHPVPNGRLPACQSHLSDP
jgi:hypothetical protein